MKRSTTVGQNKATGKPNAGAPQRTATQSQKPNQKKPAPAAALADKAWQAEDKKQPEPQQVNKKEPSVAPEPASAAEAAPQKLK